MKTIFVEVILDMITVGHFDAMVRAAKTITEGITTNPVTEPFVTSANIHRRKVQRDSRVLL